MRGWNWQRLMGLGIALMLAGIVLPGMMVLHLLPSTFLLNFLAYAASLSGFALGTFALSEMFRRDE